MAERSAHHEACDTAGRPQSIQARRDLTRGQLPMVAILTCSDSRVVPEQVFDLDTGDAFVVRDPKIGTQWLYTPMRVWRFGGFQAIRPPVRVKRSRFAAGGAGWNRLLCGRDQADAAAQA